MVPRILVVEDDIMTAKILNLLLTRAGYEVTVVHDASAAFSAAGQIDPHLLILDIVLPGMDGYEFCRLLRQEPHMKSLPILIFSSLTRPADQRQGFVAGADDYLAKPVNSHDLLSRVRSMLFFSAKTA